MAGENSSSGLSSVLPGVGSALDAVGSFFGGLFNANQARKNRAFQERMYNKQVQDNLNFWNMSNRYNLPSAQRQRLEDAGLNPLLMYGSGGAMQNVSPAQPAQAPSGSSASMSAHTNFGQALAQSALINAQIRNIDADTANKQAQAEGQSNYNWLFDQTKNVEIALKYRDYDYVNQLIDESRNRVFQSSFVNANEMASLALQNSLAIRRQNLSEYEVGNNVLQGWQAVMSGRITANAQMKSAAAQMMQAVNAAKLVPYQIGVMRATAFKLSLEGKFLKDTLFDRRESLVLQNLQTRRNISWIDVLNESNINEQQSRIFLNHIQGEYTRTLNEYKPIDEFMAPINMLTGFGAGMYFGTGNPGRLKVKGFKP